MGLTCSQVIERVIFTLFILKVSNWRKDALRLRCFSLTDRILEKVLRMDNGGLSLTFSGEDIVL